MDRDDLLLRGVYWMPCTDRDGRRLLFAVDSLARRLAEIALEPGEDGRAVTAVLRHLLDQEDPPE
jgi:hypothetical protein